VLNAGRTGLSQEAALTEYMAERVIEVRLCHNHKPRSQERGLGHPTALHYDG
jgi:hypothetical protein